MSPEAITEASTAMSASRRQAFLAAAHVGVMGVTGSKRGPLLAPIWYDYEPGGEVRFVIPRGARRFPQLERERRMSLCVQSDRWPYRYVIVEGPIVSIDPADYERDIRPLSHRYLGAERGDAFCEEMYPPEVTQDVLLVQMRPDRWLSAEYPALSTDAPPPPRNARD